MHRRRHRHRHRGNRRRHLRRRDRLDDLRVRLGDRRRDRRAYLRHPARDAPNGSAWHQGWGAVAWSLDSVVDHPDLPEGDLRLRDGDRPDREPGEQRPHLVPDVAHLVPGVERDARPEPRNTGCCRREEPSDLAWGLPARPVPLGQHSQQELPVRRPAELVRRAPVQRQQARREPVPVVPALLEPAQREQRQPVPELQRLVPPAASGRDADRRALLRDVLPDLLLWGRHSSRAPPMVPWELRTIRALDGRRAPRRWMMPILRTRLAP